MYEGSTARIAVRSSVLRLFGLVSALAAVGTITGPWNSAPPLSGALSRWLSDVPTLFFGGAVTVAHRASPSSLWLPVLLHVVYGIPFFGVLASRSGMATRARILGPIAGAWLLAMSAFDIVAGRSPLSAAMESAVPIMALVGGEGFGILLLAIGWVSLCNSRHCVPAKRALPLVLSVAGIGIASYVLLPLGLLLLSVGYAALAVYYVHEPKRRGTAATRQGQFCEGSSGMYPPSPPS